MKRCAICKLEKTPSEFNRNRRRADGLQSHCRKCNKERSRAYYSANIEAHKTATMKRKKKAIELSQRKIVEYLQKHPCVDCGYSNILALEFDHRNNKESNIATAVANGWSWDRIKKEIDKCDVRCSNCHKIKTAIAGNFYKVAHMGM